jgi:hypothetical protein
MPDETYLRLRQQSTLLAAMRHDRPGLWRDDTMRDLDLRHVRPHDLATASLLNRLDCHAAALDKADAQARAVVGGNDLVIETGQALNSDLTQIARSVHAARDLVVLSLADDESARAAELHVMRMVQEANLIGFGGTVAS